MKLLTVYNYPNNETRVRIQEAPRVQHRNARGIKDAERLERAWLNPVRGSLSTLGANFNAKRQRRWKMRLSSGKELSVGPGWGMEGRRTRFTLRAKRRMLRIGGVIDGSGRRSVMLTGTLPGSTPAALAAFASWTGYAINRLNSWVKRRLPPGEEVYWFYAWEWQKRGALHVHACVASNDRFALRRIQSEFKEFWIRLLVDISGKSEVDLFARAGGGSWLSDTGKVQADAQRVKKSVAAYLSKYLCKVEAANASTGVSLGHPSRWSGCSRALLHALAVQTQVWQARLAASQAVDLRDRLLARLSGLSVKAYERQFPYGTGSEDILYTHPGRLERVRRILGFTVRANYSAIEAGGLFVKKMKGLPQCMVWLEKHHHGEFFQVWQSVTRYAGQIEYRLKHGEEVESGEWYYLESFFLPLYEEKLRAESRAASVKDAKRRSAALTGEEQLTLFSTGA